MHHPALRLAAVALFCATSTPSWAQVPSRLDASPAATWITYPGAAPQAFGVFHFRRAFDLGAVPGSFPVHVSADNRYRLFVNGQPVAAGPQRSDLMHWRYATLDLAPYLRAGPNVVAATVWNWGPHRPVAQHSYRTAFMLQGASEPAAEISTGEAWKVLQNEGYAPLPVDFQTVGGYYASPPGEAVDGAVYPWGWEEAGFDDAAWAEPVPVDAWNTRQARARGADAHGNAGGWQLVPRSIPLMEETPVRFASVRRAEGVPDDDAFLRGEGDLVVPPHTRATLLLDQGHLTNAYAVVVASGGAGSTVRLAYAEALKDADGRKGHRDEIDGKTLSGVQDVVRPGGGERRRYQTLWFRTYRYVQLEVETAEAPLRLHDVQGVFTAYPYEERARFASDLPWLADMWAINWRVARLCAWETFFDTPYYEQLQYVGDTRIQALVSLYMSGDDRLVRQALTHFDRSRMPEGITMSRYPSDPGQYIPPFSLLYVAMVHDYWMHRDDEAFVQGLLPGIRSTLSWFEPYVGEAGLLHAMPWWSYADWVPSWGRGEPPGAAEGGSALLTLQYAYALQHAAALEEAFGTPDAAGRYRAQAERLLGAVQAQTWDAERGLFRDAPDTAAVSQQTNVMAILTGAVPPDEQGALMERVLADTSITQATYYFSYYVFEALRAAGLGDRYLSQLGPWQEMLALGLTTTLERPPPSRSDSHAWAAHPNYGLLATVLGVRPGAPGFRTVRVEPHLGPLGRAEGEVPHPLGPVQARLERDGEAGLRAEVTLPEGLTGVFVWNGEERPLQPGTQQLVF